MNEAFVQHVFGQFRQYCMEKAIVGNSVQLLDFMMSHHLIEAKTIRHFVLLQDYQMMEKQGLGKNKTARVQLIACKYEVHPNTVWNVLKDHRGKFLGANREVE